MIFKHPTRALRSSWPALDQQNGYFIISLVRHGQISCTAIIHLRREAEDPEKKIGEVESTATFPVTTRLMLLVLHCRQHKKKHYDGSTRAWARYEDEMDTTYTAHGDVHPLQVTIRRTMYNSLLKGPGRPWLNVPTRRLPDDSSRRDPRLSRSQAVVYGDVLQRDFRGSRQPFCEKKKRQE